MTQSVQDKDSLVSGLSADRLSSIIHSGHAEGGGLIARLAAALEQERVVYSHWKSNMGLCAEAERSQPGGVTAVGQEQVAGLPADYDLDLLVEQASLPRALTVLSQLGFKPAVVRWGRDTPGVGHYYGLDVASGQLVHVHLFSHVMTGESFVKSHLLPLDEMLLQDSYPTSMPALGTLRLTSKAAELVLFTLRMFIKYGSLPDLLVLRGKSNNVRREVRWLSSVEASANGKQPAFETQSLALLKRHLPQFDTALFQRCLTALDSDASLYQRMQLARQVRRQLKPYARHSYVGRLAAYARLFAAEAQRRLAPGSPRRNKRLQAGGAIIAFVGAEATGKSTLVADSGRWLGSAFAVQTVHAGKPPATLLTTPLNLLLPLLRSRLSSLRTSRLEGHVSSGEARGQDISATRNNPPHKGLASLVYALRAVTLAWERRQLLVRVARAAARGEIVLCDRYPSDNVGAMDSPRLRPEDGLRPQPDAAQGRGAAASVVSRLYNGLARLEQRLYHQIPPPDIALRLNVSLQTAQQRNRERIKPGKESDAYLISRHRQAREWRKAGTQRVHDIDTNQSLPDTIRAVRQAIWEGV